MELGMVGLGRMGGNMTERLLRAGHRVIGYATDAKAIDAVVAKGADGAHSLSELVGKLTPPRTVWLMIPSSAVDETIATLLPLLAPGDVIIDGGNSFYKETLRRAETVEAKQVHYVDVGTSGGVWGLKEGYSMMIGGDEAVVDRLRPIFVALAPGEQIGWGRVGPTGSGHFTKMVHNGIEYGMMQAFAEGFSIMQHKAEFAIDLHQVAEVWRYGSVIRSWLLDLTANALSENPTLTGIAPYVQDTGEGRWTVAEAIDLNVPAPVITLSLLQRIQSREEDSFASKLLSAMRNQFGGHAIKKEG